MDPHHFRRMKGVACYKHVQVPIDWPTKVVHLRDSLHHEAGRSALSVIQHLSSCFPAISTKTPHCHSGPLLDPQTLTGNLQSRQTYLEGVKRSPEPLFDRFPLPIMHCLNGVSVTRSDRQTNYGTVNSSK